MSHVSAENANFNLRWNIVNIFAPWQMKEGSFSLQYPAAYRFRVILKRLVRNFTRLSFQCSIVYTRYRPPGIIRYEHEGFIADTLDIRFTLNENPVNRNLVTDYPFTKETGYLYNCEVEIEDDGSVNTTLGVLIHIDVKRIGLRRARAVINGLDVRLLYGGRFTDMENLFSKLRESLMNRSYCTMRILSSENTEHFVHHCIIQGRWTNFFALHNLDETSDFVNTDISDVVLSNIILYMYTSRIDEIPLRMWDLPAVSELFQVISRYEIFHLYQALRKTEKHLHQLEMNFVERRTISIGIGRSHFFRDTHPRKKSMTFPIYVYPSNIIGRSRGHSFVFTVHVRHVNLAGPWLSYSMLSRTAMRFNLQVSLSLAKNGGSVTLIHSDDYVIPGDEQVSSEPMLFLGSSDIFSQNDDDDEIPRLLFGFTFSDGISNVCIWHQSHPTDIIREPREIFSEHMINILRRKFRTDLVVQPRDYRNGRVAHRIHKSIFNARLPGWRNVVEPRLPEEAVVPDAVTLFLSNESYQLVVSYMYSGIMPLVPVALYREILQFAVNSNFEALRNLVSSMRDF